MSTLVAGTPTPSVTPPPNPNPRPPGDLVAEGARLFLQETFGGNGRTCGTCHSPTTNFTLSPEFIAMLPPDDPLFVAERDPALAGLENLALLRSSALILENVDGFDQPPVFRGVPHIFNEAFTAPYGWSGSFAILRDLTVHAVMQHFPRTLNRVPGVDFRLPTDAEFDALDAFMRSLPIPADTNFDLDGLLTTDAQRRGRDAFFSLGCAECHTPPFLTNDQAFDIGVTRQPVDLVPPCDGCPPIGPLEAGGGRPFDVPTLFGLAKTAPYFHDNSARTLRDAVAFFTSADFNASPGAAFSGPISLTDAEIDDITVFLTALTPCGNGVVDHGEACDDGNDVVSDGCRPNCTLERCGDGILDPGEACDDGNTLDGDGCSSTCLRTGAPGDVITTSR